jgi:hypothetical protein
MPGFNNFFHTCWVMFSVSCAKNYLSTLKLVVKLFHTNEVPRADIADFLEQILQILYFCASAAHKELVAFAFHSYQPLPLSLFLLVCCSVTGLIRILPVTEKVMHSIWQDKILKNYFHYCYIKYEVIHFNRYISLIL